MYETTRHQYLAAMGIDSYMPRCLLPHAAASVECDWPPLMGQTATTAVTESDLAASQGLGAAAVPAGEPYQDAPAPAVVSQSEVASAQSGHGARGAAELLAGFEPKTPGHQAKVKDTQAVAAADERQQAQQTQPEPQQALSFSLTLWRFDDVVVIDSRNSAKALPTEKLLLSMLQAFGLQLGNLPQPQVLQWPMVDMPQADTSAAAAREMLGAYLDTLLDTPVSGWWLMGQDALHLLPPSVLPQGEQAIGQLVAADELPDQGAKPLAQLITMPSLTQMLERPQLKAKAWQVMQQALAALPRSD